MHNLPQVIVLLLLQFMPCNLPLELKTALFVPGWVKQLCVSSLTDHGMEGSDMFTVEPLKKEDRS